MSIQWLKDYWWMGLSEFFFDIYFHFIEEDSIDRLGFFNKSLNLIPSYIQIFM
jgi:hypothetical protein